MPDIILCVFFFNDTATTEIYTLSLHDALPISSGRAWRSALAGARSSRPVTRSRRPSTTRRTPRGCAPARRSEEHTSELQSRQYLVCRLLLEKKKEHDDITSTAVYHTVACAYYA